MFTLDRTVTDGGTRCLPFKASRSEEGRDQLKDLGCFSGETGGSSCKGVFEHHIQMFLFLFALIQKKKKR